MTNGMKLWVLGQTSGNPDDWDASSYELVIAATAEDAQIASTSWLRRFEAVEVIVSHPTAIYLHHHHVD